MNILFVLYGDFFSNSANPLALYCRELRARGHHCVVAVPSNLKSVRLYGNPAFTPILFDDLLTSPSSVFPDRRPADVIHACTPRKAVRQFVTSYLIKRPTPLVIYLEDDESWLSSHHLRPDESNTFCFSDEKFSDDRRAISCDPLGYDSFIGSADAVAVIQDKLKGKVPPWVACETVMLGVDLDFFSPRSPVQSLRKSYGIAEEERVIVYHGGLDQFKLPAIESLCEAVGLINQQGYACRLLRTGPRPLVFLAQLPSSTASRISDLGMLPKHQLPELLALADVFVQPGRIDSFEDLRLPGKIPEFLAMGRPLILPNVNIAHLFKDGLDAVLLRTGDAEEIAAKCIDLFRDPERASAIGRAGRRVAERYFDVRAQALCLEEVYQAARESFRKRTESPLWPADRTNLAVAPSVTPCGEALAAAIARRDAQIGLLKQALAERDEQILALFASKSWQLTSPMRFAQHQLRRTVRLVRVLQKLPITQGFYLLRSLIRWLLKDRYSRRQSWPAAEHDGAKHV